ncbi:uncharacterized protein V1518DRAFT_390853 [Limtongia smithiae]|uniref:uncharacterized protein n=1 Tax=Limtongia smithiae TaxID=1125753 RepID=UPI0034CED31B
MVKKKQLGVQYAFTAPVYQLPYLSVLGELGSDAEQGLPQTEAAGRLELYGPNQLDGQFGASLVTVIGRQCVNAMGLVLVLAMSLSFGVHDYVEGGVISAVVILNVVVGVIQEYRAEQTINSLRSMSSPTANVIRDGLVHHIPSLNVVPGDIVQVRTGDVVPADLRLIDTMNFETDEALLTGESLPVLKDHAIVFPLNDNVGVGDRINLAYSSSTVTKGRAQGVVISTGMATEIGRIAASLSGKNRKEHRSMNMRKYGPLQLFKGIFWRSWDGLGSFLGITNGTPLQRKLSMLAYLLLVFACILALIVFGSNNFEATHEVTIYAISVGIAIIPESLVAVLTITMAVGMRRMAAKQVIVRKLDALEALGGVTNICSDKTGTLTQGKMLVRKAWIPNIGYYLLEGSQFSDDPTSGNLLLERRCSSSYEHNEEVLSLNMEKGVDATVIADQEEKDLQLSQEQTKVLPPPITLALAAFLKVCSLCSLATVRFDSAENTWLTSGDPTEIALQVFAYRFSYGRKDLLQQGWTQLAEYPFDSNLKMMTVIFESPTPEKSESRGEVQVLSKGAVERILSVCTGVGCGGDYCQMTTEVQEQIMSTVTDLASQGLRVLAIAGRTETSPKLSYLDFPRESIERNLSFLGLAGIYDPPRLETKNAVAECKDAGIKVHMLTGDHPATAKAIAEEVGIIPKSMDEVPLSAARNLVMTAAEFDGLSDAEIDRLDTLPLVIARCAPNTKVRMIEALHRRKQYAAMTGDGVNDSPSLKIADIGIAMGMGGSDVAKAASDLVLTDDNFASIVSAIEEGRRMFDNIQKFVLHLLTANVAEVILLIIGLAFKDEAGLSVFPLAPLQILWINMITSPGPAFGLSMEPAGKSIMKRPPHNLKKGIFTWEIMIDNIVYGIVMGLCCLINFCVIIYGHGNGDLGRDCNSGYNSSCYTVFRARSTMFAQLTWLILVSAWEFKDVRQSLFRLNTSSSTTTENFRFPFIRDLYANKFLFYSVIIGMLSVIPVIYIPKLNTDVFKMRPITWEWSLAFASVVVFLVGMESWKAIKRRMRWFMWAMQDGGEAEAPASVRD